MKSDWLYFCAAKDEEAVCNGKLLSHARPTLWDSLDYTVHGILQARTLEKLYTISKSKTWSWLWLRSSIPYTKIQAKNKVGNTTWLVRYDLNQVPYYYTVEVINQFKGLDLVECRRTMNGGA